MRNGEFQYDLFLSCSPHDVEVAREITDRLQTDDLSVRFFDGNSPLNAKLLEDIQQSRNLIFCWSATYETSEWQNMSTQFAMFQTDPGRQLAALRFDNTPLPDNQIDVIDWQEQDSEPYGALLEICQIPTRSSQEIRTKNYIALARSTINKTADQDTRENYLEALRASLGIKRGQSVSSIDFQDQQSIIGPQEIAALYGTNVEQLHQYLVFLSRRQAVEFLYFRGYRITLNRFRTLASSPRYEEVFDRQISVSAGNRRIYTYAEILMLVQFDVTLKFND